jgi:pimeloyl-ACP methyl ester carboxylesterase
MSSVQHVSLWSQSPALPMMETRPQSRNTIIFVGGLSDTLATVPYLPLLAEAIAPLDFSLVQPQLSSSLGGFGLSSLEADAQELCLVVRHLLSRTENPKPKDGKLIIMGHSTGCQDIAHLLSKERPDVRIDGAILQAPVSDREYFEEQNGEGSEGRTMLHEATALKEQGRGATLLQRNIDPSQRPTSKYEINGSAFQDPAMTAYRYWSLNAVGGDDDYFSSNLEEERVAQIWSDAVARGGNILALLGAEE